MVIAAPLTVTVPKIVTWEPTGSVQGAASEVHGTMLVAEIVWAFVTVKLAACDVPALKLPSPLYFATKEYVPGTKA